MLTENPLNNSDFHILKQFNMSPSISTDTNTPDNAYNLGPKTSNFKANPRTNPSSSKKKTQKPLIPEKLIQNDGVTLEFLDADAIMANDRLYSFGVNIESEEEVVTKKIKKKKEKGAESEKKGTNGGKKNSGKKDGIQGQKQNSNSELTSVSSFSNVPMTSNQKFENQDNKSEEQIDFPAVRNSNTPVQDSRELGISSSFQNQASSAKKCLNFLEIGQETQNQIFINNNVNQNGNEVYQGENLKKIEEEISTDSLTCKEDNIMLIEIDLDQNTLQSLTADNNNNDSNINQKQQQQEQYKEPVKSNQGQGTLTSSSTLGSKFDQQSINQEQIQIDDQIKEIKPLERRVSVEDIFLKLEASNTVKKHVPIGRKFQADIPMYCMNKPDAPRRNIQKLKVWDCEKIDVSVTQRCLKYLQMYHGAMVYEEDACKILAQCDYNEQAFRKLMSKDAYFWKMYFENLTAIREEQHRKKMKKQQQKKKN